MMSVQLPIEEIARGDYSPEYGTVESVVDEGNSIKLTFMNGKVFAAPKETELEIDQGGRFEHDGLRRPEEGAT